MHSIKVFVVILFASAILTSSIAQSKDTVIVKDSATVSDSVMVRDSISTKKIRGDSTSTPDSVNIKKIKTDSMGVPDSLILMQKEFEQFKYGDVISMANRLLLQKYPYTKKDLLDIYKMVGIAHYSLSEDDAAKKSFIEILRIDSTYQFDSTKVSPKIISFYRQVKNDYVEQQKEIEARTVVRIDTIYVPQKEYDYDHMNMIKGAIARSIFVPGLGQFYKEEYFKGILLTVLSSAALVSSVFYIIDTNEKEKAYLVEMNPALIEAKYQDYNSSFKKRNISLIAYGVIWLYSQIDLLFLSDDEPENNNVLKNTSMYYDDYKRLTLSLKYFF